MLFSYGIVLVIFAVILYYVVQPGISDCHSFYGYVKKYSSADFLQGCDNIERIQTGSIIIVAIGIGIAVYGTIRKNKNKANIS